MKRQLGEADEDAQVKRAHSKRFYKLLAADYTHRGFTYREGLNVNNQPWNAEPICSEGGLYFSSFKYLGRWFRADWPMIADVEVPDDAQMVKICDKYKADRVVLSNFRSVREFLAEQDDATLYMWLQLAAICDLAALDVIVTQATLSDDILLGVLDDDRSCVTAQFFKGRSDRVRIAAVQRNPEMLELFEKPISEAVYLAAIASNPERVFVGLKHDDQTEALCLAAVQRSPNLLMQVQKQTPAICFAAVMEDPHLLELVDPELQSEGLCMAAVALDWTVFKMVRVQTPNICRLVLSKFPDARSLVNIPLDF